MPRTAYRFVERDYVRYALATHHPEIVLDALHAAPPNSDQWTGEIAQIAGQRSGAHCIIATFSRNVADLNRPRSPCNADAIDEYRSVLRDLLWRSEMLDSSGQPTRPILHLAIHGMKDGHGTDLEVGTSFGESCSADVINWVLEQLRARCRLVPKSFKITRDTIFPGDVSKKVHRHGELATAYRGYGEAFNTLQIEIARWLRKDHRQSVTETIVEIAAGFGNAFPRRPTNRPS